MTIDKNDTTTIDKNSTATIDKIPAATTCIGSLPHHNVDSALTFSFRTGIPFLPQIPIRNPWEFMIAQALEDLPGLQAEKDGQVSLNIDIWKTQRKDFNDKLTTAFKNEKNPDAFERFEPSSATSSSWQAFLWELQERKSTLAKLQIAGPLTSQWVIQGDQDPEFSSLIFKLVLAKSLAMTRKIQSLGITPILFLDEPGLYAFDKTNPRHVVAFQELKLLIQTLNKNNVLVGLHCCSNADWKSILSLGLSFLSIDTSLSLESLVQKAGPELEKFILDGSRLSLGVVPTTRASALRSLTAEILFSEVAEILSKLKPKIARKILIESLLTPACGLALQSVAESETILDLLNDFQALRQGRK